MIVRELVTRLGFSVQDANLKKYESGVNNIKRSAENAASSFRNIFAAFVGFSALKSIANTADQMQSMEARVGMLPQTIGEAGTAFDEVASRATAARQSIDAYGNLYIKVQNAGKNFIKTQAEGLQITDTLAKALVVGGASAQEQSSAMLQFAQALGSGVLQGDELRAMAEASPQFMDELANAIGVPREQIKKMGSEGKLTSKIIVEAVKKMSSVFDERFKQMPMTIGQATTVIGNKWDMFINRLNRKSGTVTKVANFLLDGFDKIEAGLEIIVDFFGGATQTIKIFGIVLAAALAPLIAGGFVAALGMLMNPMTWIIGALVALGLVIEDVYQFMTGGESVIGDFVNWLNDGSVAAGIMKGILIALGLVLGALAIAFTAAWLAAAGPITATVIALMALYGTFLFFKTEVIQIMSDVWKSITDQFEVMIGKLKSGWNSFKSSIGIGTSVDASVVAGAATSAGGTGASAPLGGQNITVNQTLPPGTAPETAAAAKGATEQALIAADSSAMARQMGVN